MIVYLIIISSNAKPDIEEIYGKALLVDQVRFTVCKNSPWARWRREGNLFWVVSRRMQIKHGRLKYTLQSKVTHIHKTGGSGQVGEVNTHGKASEGTCLGSQSALTAGSDSVARAKESVQADYLLRGALFGI